MVRELWGASEMQPESFSGQSFKQLQYDFFRAGTHHRV
jgi:hypothetical protein